MITDINEYQKEALVTADYGSQEYPFLLLAEESGEVVGKLNKFSRKRKCSTGEAVACARNPANDVQMLLREQVKKELGDVAWSWVVACDELDLDPAEVFADNIAKLRDRQSRGVICGSGDDR